MDNVHFPAQAIPYKMKTTAWRKQVVNWAKNRTFQIYAPCRKSVMHKKINYDLITGKLHINDLALILNPENLKGNFIAENIQHYPIMNSKLNVLKGEEIKRPFDYRVIVTNPTAISEKEEEKKNLILKDLQELMTKNIQSEEEMQAATEKIAKYYSYDWQDLREIRANSLLNHYSKELGFPLIFNQGFSDAEIVGEEIYQVDIEGGEPTLKRLNPLKVECIKSGYSNKVEDSDIIILEDYWSPGKIIDTYYDQLSKKDIKYIEELPYSDSSSYDSMDNVDERVGMVNMGEIGLDWNPTESFFWDPTGETSVQMDLMPYDMAGNVRVLKVFWKSKRQIKRVKSYNSQTGEEEYNFYTEDYQANVDLGEEESLYYINQAWEGVLIGEKVYVNMKPRPVQFNRLSNPSRCHFGIIGSYYNLNDDKPFSIVDMLKPYNYLYDVIYDRLNKLLARNWGLIMNVDLAKIPDKWDMDKWLYFAKKMGIAVTDSFREGNKGSATGKLAGLMSGQQSTINADLGNSIQQCINILTYIKQESGELIGINKQREGQISNQATVGGVERATLQSSHITEWIFTIHDDLKKRVLEAFLEVCKIALKGKSVKFQYILSDMSETIMDIEGDEFADCDYGLVVDNGTRAQELEQRLDSLVQAALQNASIDFSTVMKIYGSGSLAEKQRMIENNEKDIQQRQQETQQQQQKIQEQQLQYQQNIEQQKLEMQDKLNQRDNETKLAIANIQKDAQESDGDNMEENGNSEETLEKIREFEEKMNLENKKLSQADAHHKDEITLKKEALKSKNTIKK